MRSFLDPILRQHQVRQFCKSIKIFLHSRFLVVVLKCWCSSYFGNSDQLWRKHWREVWPSLDQERNHILKQQNSPKKIPTQQNLSNIFKRNWIFQIFSGIGQRAMWLRLAVLPQLNSYQVFLSTFRSSDQQQINANKHLYNK